MFRVSVDFILLLNTKTVTSSSYIVHYTENKFYIDSTGKTEYWYLYTVLPASQDTLKGLSECYISSGKFCGQINELVRVKRGFDELLCSPNLWEHFQCLFCCFLGVTYLHRYKKLAGRPSLSFSSFKGTEQDDKEYFFLRAREKIKIKCLLKRRK